MGARIGLNRGVAFALIAVCLGLVVLGAGQAVIRRVVDERRSVRDYQHTLQTLGSLSQRGARAAREREAPEPDAPLRPADPVRPRHPGWSVAADAVRASSVTMGLGPDHEGVEHVDGSLAPMGNVVESLASAQSNAPASAVDGGVERLGRGGSDQLGDRRDGPSGDRRADPLLQGSLRASDRPGAGPRDRSEVPEDEATRPVFVFDDMAPARSAVVPSSSVGAAPALRGMPGPLSPVAASDRSELGARPGTELGTRGPRLPSPHLPGARRMEGRRMEGRGPGVEPSRLLHFATGVAAALLVGAVAATVALGGREGSSAHQSSAVRTRSPSASSSTSHATTSQRHHRARLHTVEPTDRTVAPTAVTLYDATVPVSSTSYTVVVSVSAPCWVEAQQTSTGSDIWSGVLTGGTQHTFSLTGSVLLRIGAADATVSVDGAVVAFPSGYQVPYNLTFVPS